MTLFHCLYLLVSVQLNYTINIRQKGVPAKANPLNTNDLCRFHRQELCRLFGGMGWRVLGTWANVGRGWGGEIGTSINVDRS